MESLASFLLMYSTTPQGTMPVPPAVLFIGCPLCTCLDLLCQSHRYLTTVSAESATWQPQQTTLCACWSIGDGLRFPGKLSMGFVLCCSTVKTRFLHGQDINRIVVEMTYGPHPCLCRTWHQRLSQQNRKNAVRSFPLVKKKSHKVLPDTQPPIQSILPVSETPKAIGMIVIVGTWFLLLNNFSLFFIWREKRIELIHSPSPDDLWIRIVCTHTLVLSNIVSSGIAGTSPSPMQNIAWF